MHKRDSAAQFFERLVQEPSDFITRLIETEMDSDLIELFNKFGGQLQAGDMDPERFRASLLIIGYLVRSHEERTRPLTKPENQVH